MDKTLVCKRRDGGGGVGGLYPQHPHKHEEVWQPPGDPCSSWLARLELVSSGVNMRPGSLVSFHC